MIPTQATVNTENKNITSLLIIFHDTETDLSNRPSDSRQPAFARSCSSRVTIKAGEFLQHVLILPN